MRIIIDMVDELYDSIQKVQNGSIASKWVLNAVKNGTPLPGGHGDLIDRDELYGDADYDDGEYYAVSTRQIREAPTIIEADKEVGICRN